MDCIECTVEENEFNNITYKDVMDRQRAWNILYYENYIKPKELLVGNGGIEPLTKPPHYYGM